MVTQVHHGIDCFDLYTAKPKSSFVGFRKCLFLLVSNRATYSASLSFNEKILKHFLQNLKKNTKKTRQIGSKHEDKLSYGTIFLNHVSCNPKGDSNGVVPDAPHSNSNTDQAYGSWPIGPLAPELARAEKENKSAIDLMYAYVYAPSDKNTIRPTNFFSGGKPHVFYTDHNPLIHLVFFTREMAISHMNNKRCNC